jgi:predicted ABC-type ATPase
MEKSISSRSRRTIKELHEIYKLTDEEKEKISKRIINQYTQGVQPSTSPVVVILGGQPGSGKSQLITIAQKRLNNNAVICNADDYRDFHPKSEEIKRKYEKHYPDITVKYSQPWNAILQSYCEERKLNYILETTFSSGNQMNETITRIKNIGYRVLVMVLSVAKKLSFLGTRIRYESMKERDGYGRVVDKLVHDQKYEAVAKTLQMTVHANRYDEVFIYGRPIEVSNEPPQGLILIGNNSVTAYEDYLSERDREWHAQDWNYYLKEVLQLINKMVNRKAKNKELKEIFDLLEIKSFLS